MTSVPCIAGRYGLKDLRKPLHVANNVELSFNTFRAVAKRPTWPPVAQKHHLRKLTAKPVRLRCAGHTLLSNSELPWLPSTDRMGEVLRSGGMLLVGLSLQ